MLLCSAMSALSYARSGRQLGRVPPASCEDPFIVSLHCFCCCWHMDCDHMSRLCGSMLSGHSVGVMNRLIKLRCRRGLPVRVRTEAATAASSTSEVCPPGMGTTTCSWGTRQRRSSASAPRRPPPTAATACCGPPSGTGTPSAHSVSAGTSGGHSCRWGARAGSKQQRSDDGKNQAQ